MGFGHLVAAYRLELGNPGRKSVLCALAFRACDACGLCWPGVKWLVATTEMSERRVQACLAELSGAGLLGVRRYSRGGRGVSTEYIVLPQQLAKLSTAPCGDCQSRMKNPAGGAGYPDSTPQAVRGIEAKPRSSGAETPQYMGDHQSENLDQSGSASPPSEETALSGRSALDPSPASEIPATAKDALRGLGLFTPPRDTSKAP